MILLFYYLDPLQGAILVLGVNKKPHLYSDEKTDGHLKTAVLKEKNKYKFVWQTDTNKHRWKIDYAALSICMWVKRNKVCVSIFHPRANASFPLSLSFFLFQSQVGHSLMQKVASPCPQKWTARIVMSWWCLFVGGLSNKKQNHTTINPKMHSRFPAIPEPFICPLTVLLFMAHSCWQLWAVQKLVEWSKPQKNLKHKKV